MTGATWVAYLSAVVLLLPSHALAAESVPQPKVTSTENAPVPDHRLLSASGLTGAYVGFGAWTWFAWYRDKPTLAAWKYGGDGGFSLHTYAGGADKLGHVWSTLVLSRLGAELLEAGGWSDVAASAISASLCLGAFTLMEVNDGYYTEFSAGDLTADALGVGVALAMRHVPELDDALDFRVQWFPSPEFRRAPGANFAEDYSGQTYLLAFKSRAIRALRDSSGPLWALQFANPVIGFESRNYVPEQAAGERVTHRQAVFLGLTIDVQAIIDETLTGRSSSVARTSHAAGHTLFEYVNLPFSTVPVLSVSREQAVTVPEG